ncbi:unnamed protein product [Allacma fusca]|uniref:Uncharacterized protein n=1 Tax=Allacma fusca TaxID=39272 RepID=A0A8J2J4Z2_9HEXA|nr:unnamed protein product [Allacma fusca]
MNSSVVCIVLLAVVALSSARPGVIYSYPAASSDTSVVRDALGNQQTSYAYQDGHSSAVALTRNDVSKHLVYQTAPVVYETPAYYQSVPAVYNSQAAYYV